MTTKDYQTRSPLRIFLSYFKPHRRLFALDLSCAFLIACIDLAFPLVSRAAMYTWLPQRQFRVFFIVMAVVVAAYVLRSALYFVVAYWGHTFGIRVEADIRRDLYRHIQELGFDFYDRNRTGQLMSRLTSDLFELTELAHHGPEDLFISLVTIVGALAVMFTLRWELALVLLVLLPVLLTMALRRRRRGLPGPPSRRRGCAASRCAAPRPFRRRRRRHRSRPRGPVHVRGAARRGRPGWTARWPSAQ